MTSAARKTLLQTLALGSSIAVAYAWLSIPSLTQYSLQAFGACFILYFILKKANKEAIWEVLPTTAVDEMVLVTFAFLILIGATGATTSVFFSLIFVYLFFVSMTMERWTSIFITLSTLLFFYALEPALSNSLHLSHLISIPLVTVFFLFAKYQHELAKEKQTLVSIEHNEIHSYKIFLNQKEQELESVTNNTRGWLKFFDDFLFNFLQPKIEQTLSLLEFPQNHNAVKGQLTLMRIELEKIKMLLQEKRQENQNGNQSSQNNQNNQDSSQPSNQRS
jgi:cell division protein FtsW (lipid II flippase)